MPADEAVPGDLERIEVRSGLADDDHAQGVGFDTGRLVHAGDASFRDHDFSRDIGTLEVDRLAEEFIADLERRAVIVPFRNNTYILQMEQYRLQPKAKDEQEAEPAPAA